MAWEYAENATRPLNWMTTFTLPTWAEVVWVDVAQVMLTDTWLDTLQLQLSLSLKPVLFLVAYRAVAWRSLYVLANLKKNIMIIT